MTSFSQQCEPRAATIPFFPLSSRMLLSDHFTIYVSILFLMDGQSEGFSIGAVIFNVAVNMPECAFQTQTLASPFGVERALELLGVRVNVSSYLVEIVKQFSTVLHQSTLPPAEQPTHSTSLGTVTGIFNFIHSDGCVMVPHYSFPFSLLVLGSEPTA